MCVVTGTASAQTDFHAKVTVVSHSPEQSARNGEVVVWLTPLSGDPPIPEPKRARLVQHNKQFEPHLLVIPVGSTVDFPNKDPFFHNVFSLYKGKRFDLGLYEAGSSRAVRFDRPGASFIFCNIHPQMSAVVIALPTPYYGISDSEGDITITNVPAGRYRLETWYEFSTSEALAKNSRVITLPDDVHLALRVQKTIDGPVSHKNKYGKDYDPASGEYPQ